MKHEEVDVAYRWSSIKSRIDRIVADNICGVSADSHFHLTSAASIRSACYHQLVT